MKIIRNNNQNKNRNKKAEALVKDRHHHHHLHPHPPLLLRPVSVAKMMKLLMNNAYFQSKTQI